MTVIVHPDINVPQELEVQFQHTLNHLRHHVLSHGLNSELMASPARVFSVRINRKARLLIASYLDEQSTLCWVVLDCLSDHNYKSVYLRMSQRALEEKIAMIRQVYAKALAAMPAVAEVITDEREVEEAPVTELEFYQSRLIKMTAEQDEVVHARLPLVVNGVAGSGKTCVGLSVLRQASADASITAPAVYVATSSALVVQMQANYLLAYGEDNTVLFLTYQAVLAMVLPQAICVSDEHLACWLETYIRAKKHSSPISLSVEQLSREFRQVCIFHECQDYLEVGARHSSLSENQKKWVFTAYQAYRAHLLEQGQVHPDLYHERVRSLFSFVVADESQDLSPAALSTLSTLVPRDSNHAPQIVYLADANQSLENGNLLVLHHLSRLVGEDNIKTLPVSHRCPSAVIEYANRVLALRNSISGGIYDKYTQSTLAKTESEHQPSGEMIWTASYQEQWTALSQTTDFAVVTPAEYVEEARTRFNTPLVLTPKQIKGLEYKTVVVYRMLEGEHVRAINNRVKEEGVRTNVNRARKDELKAETVPLVIYLNELFTAFTRALYRLHVFQPVIHQNQHVMDFFNPPQVERAVAAACKINVADSDSSATERTSAWEAELARQEAMGNQEVVKEIKQKLKTMPVLQQQTPSFSPSSREVAAPADSGEQREKKLPLDSTALLTSARPAAQEAFRPLSEAQANYVQLFFKNLQSNIEGSEDNNLANVKSFLTHKRAYAMLFMHLMQNGQTLFDNLIEYDNTFKFKRLIKSAGLLEVYFSLLKTAILGVIAPFNANNPAISFNVVISILCLEWPVSREYILNGIRENPNTTFLNKLACSEKGCSLINKEWYFFKSILTLEIFNKPCETGESLLFIFIMTQAGRTILESKWNEIKTLLTIEGMNRPAKTDQYKGMSPFFLLAIAGQVFLRKKWSYFKNLLCTEGLNRACEMGDYKGISLLHVLATDKHRLLESWEDIKPLITQESFNRASQVEHNKGSSPLYAFAGTPTGCRLLKENWDHMRPLITQEGLSRSVHIAKDKGLSPLAWLVLYGLFEEKWADLKSLLTPEAFNHSIEAPLSVGTSPLYFLTSNNKSVQFLKENWDEIKPFITQEGFNRGTTAPTETGKSSLYHLMSRPEGCLLIKEKWEDFKHLITTEGLNRAVGSEHCKGATPFFWLTCFEEGRELIVEKWDEMKSFLTWKGMTAEVIIEGVPQTPFYHFTSAVNTRQLILDKVDDFKLLVNSRSTLPTRETCEAAFSSIVDGTVLTQSAEKNESLNTTLNTSPLVACGFYASDQTQERQQKSTLEIKG